MRLAVLLTALAVLSGAPAPLRAQARDCSTLGQVTFVRDVLRDLYFWYREVPDLNPALFASPEAYLDAARFRPLDTSFSFITTQAEQTALFSDSQFVGYGFGNKLLAADDLRVSQVYPDSPALDVGMARGDRILEINGRTIGDLFAAGLLGGAFGPAEVGHPTEMLLRDTSGRERRVAVQKRVVTIPTVSNTRVYDVDGRRVGYIFFRNFVEPSIPALDAAFAEVKAAGATDLVLDLRYNGGGLISVAQHLAALIGGARTDGQLLLQYVHNDRNTFRNRSLLFEPRAGALDLPRLVVITTRSSASASELIVNSLRPFMPVTVVGDRTFGKPVGQYSLNFCEKVFVATSFTVRNALNEGDYFDGLPADCPAGDDLDHMLGDPEEASLAEALGYVRTGQCTGGARKASRDAGRRPLGSAWQVLVGAH
jgi:carboxyl-terminal processing protease